MLFCKDCYWFNPNESYCWKGKSVWPFSPACDLYYQIRYTYHTSTTALPSSSKTVKYPSSITFSTSSMLNEGKSNLQ